MVTEFEHILTTSRKPDIISYINSHPECFEEAICLSISDKQPYAWRAAWVLWSYLDYNDERMQPHIGKIINCLSGKTDGHLKELFHILLFMDVDEDYEGELFDVCVSTWEKTNKTPSARYGAFRLITKIAKKYPDLISEIKHLVQPHYIESLSPGVRNGVLTMYNELVK